LINVDGLGHQAVLRIELLDHLERPIPGYSTSVSKSGFQTPIILDKREPLPQRVRLRVVFEGAKRSKIRLSAIYIRPGKSQE